MSKQITVPGVFAVIILFMLLGTLPNDSVTDTKSAMQNAGENYATYTAVNAGEEAIEILGNQAVDSVCKDSSSQACSTTISSLNTIAIAWTIFVTVLVIGGIIGAAKWIMNVIESF